MGDRLVSSRRAGGGDRSEVIAAGFDVPEVEIHEGNQPTVIGFFTYPNELVGECGGEVDLATSWQMDEAVVAYARHVDFGRALHVESFVGALGIELLDEIVETLLLLQQIFSCGAGGFGLQRAVHSLVSTVVLRMGWSAALKLDP